MKSLTGICKALAIAQKLQCRTTIFEDHLLMTASALKYDHYNKKFQEFKTILV